jgi:hypothetical protein
VGLRVAIGKAEVPGAVRGERAVQQVGNVGALLGGWPGARLAPRNVQGQPAPDPRFPIRFGQIALGDLTKAAGSAGTQ